MKPCLRWLFFTDDNIFHVSGKAEQEFDSKFQADSNEANKWSTPKNVIRCQ